MNKTLQLKKATLAALESTLGVVTQACKKAGVSRTQYYQWLREDEEFAQQVDDINEVAIDFVESQLYKQIQESNTTATIFYLKTKAKHRGYSERHEISGPDGEPMQPFQIIVPPPKKD